MGDRYHQQVFGVKIDAQAEEELLKEQLRRIIDSYNKTSKGIIDEIGR
jgi:hypothetical protein